MEMNEMVIISVDDHITEPADMFDRHLKGDALATAPRMMVAENGANFWEYQGQRMLSVANNAVVGRPPEQYGYEPTALEQLRKGVYDVDARVDDMNINGIAASMNFASNVGFEAGLFVRAPDKDMALVHLRAYNDWHIDEWCGAHPGRFIPCGLLPVWDMDATVDEVKRLAAKGCHAVSINENPTKQGLPSIHNPYWEPMLKAVNDADIAICLHIGAGNPSPKPSSETPIEAWNITMPMSVAVGAADWLHLEALQRYGDLKIALSEGSIGWIPYFLERADFSHSRQHAWTNSRFPTKPSDLFKKHFLTCFIDDAFGLKNLEAMNEDMVAYECDYPHSDSLWPHAPEFLWDSVKHLSDERINKVTHANAMRFFSFDPFKHHQREDLTVGALRKRASEVGVDTSYQSSGGVAPLLQKQEGKVVTIGDVDGMMERRNELLERPSRPVAAA